MMSDLVCVGLNHQMAPVEIRERAAFHAMDVDGALHSLLACDAINEAAILSTCNRVELYAHGNWAKAQDSLEDFLHQYHGIPERTLSPHIYRLNGIDALAQLFRVATSVDSLMIGEPQILGQVKEAYSRAHKAGSVGPSLTQAFSQAFLTAKRVRNETTIGKNAVTVSFAAAQLAQKVFGNLKDLSCLLIGAGKMSELAAQYFKKKGAHVIVANRSLVHAQILAQKYNGQAHNLKNVAFLLQTADVVLTSTASNKFLISCELIRRVMRVRRYKPIFLVDIAVPRNIDPQTSSIDGVYLYNIDDLAQLAAANFQDRHKEVILAEAIIQEELLHYTERCHEKRVAPLIATLRKKSFQIADQEVAKTLGSLDSEISLETRQKIEQMVYAIVNKMLHKPITELKSYAKENPVHEQTITLAAKLFGV
jgi:glutamyl-tRNA reductase